MNVLDSLDRLVLDLTKEGHEPDWEAASSAASRRRAELGLTQAEVVARMPDDKRIAEETYRRFERNEKATYRRTTLRLISEALDWPAYTLWALAHGAKISDTEEVVEMAQLVERVERLESRVNAFIAAMSQAVGVANPLALPPGDGDED